jgi:hypothetical protein
MVNRRGRIEYTDETLKSKLLPEKEFGLERATGFEPATKSLGSSYSTN